MTYHSPPNTTNRHGRPRRVGVEFEFAGLAGRDAASALTSAIGGKTREEHAHRFLIEGTELGNLVLELDTQYVHPGPNSKEPPLLKGARKLLGDMAQVVVPYEVVTEPMPLDQLPKLDRVTTSLRAAGAMGTSANPTYAFGMHLNPEACSLEPDYLLRVIQAFIVLNDRLRSEIRPDPSRELLGWADPYPDEYRSKILAPAYAPGLDDLISDYVEANPGRNYDLDMLPLFAEADRARVENLIGEMLSKPRPAFHYRLPDCRIDEPRWSAAADWNRWVEVERLAEDRERLAALCHD